jgi:hypothetical protein
MILKCQVSTATSFQSNLDVKETTYNKLQHNYTHVYLSEGSNTFRRLY